MKVRRSFLGCGVILALSCGLSGAYALASTPFAITATNVTMPSSGNGESVVSVSGIPTAGTLGIVCQYSGPPTDIKLPTCPVDNPCLMPPGPFQLPMTPGQTFTGPVTFLPYGEKPPICVNVKLGEPPPLVHQSSAGLVLAGALMLCFGLRSRARRWLVLAIFAAGTLAGLAGVSGCGGSSSNTYPYTITATYMETGSNVPLIANATIEVTLQ